MVKVEKESDIDLLDGSHYLIKKYIHNHFNLICKNYDCTDLKQVGAIFYLQEKSDFKEHKKMGLSLPFDKAIYENSNLLILEDRKSKITILQVIYLLNNDMAITVIFDIKCLDGLTKSWFLEDCTERTVYL